MGTLDRRISPKATRRRKQAVASHVQQYGHWCPGWHVLPHYSMDLTADHIEARGTSGEWSELQILCRSCNSRKRTRPADKPLGEAPSHGNPLHGLHY